MLNDKNIVVGVCGGIAVYKVLDIISQLKKLGANIDVIMTEAATKFVNPITFQTISQNSVVTDMFERPPVWDIKHISLAQKADLFLIVPATANIIGKIANGIADDMLTTTVMATKAPVIIAPAMNTNMYENPIFQKNIKTLENLNYKIIYPETGRLACGDVGSGKLPSPQHIVNEVINFFEELNLERDFEGKRILVTAGPTQEPIDPVRFITNHSSGKMGYALAKHGASRGAEVILISGPTNLETPLNVKRINVQTSLEMYHEVMRYFESCDIIIKAAAVADYRPKNVSSKKIKKTGDDLLITLTRNPDILAELGKIKGNKILVGFAAETDDLIENAKMKIMKKNLDLIIANDVTNPEGGFKSDTNVISIIDKEGNVMKYDKMEKEKVAKIIFDRIKELL